MERRDGHCRILVTGNAGSGKSTLAAEIGRALDLPVFGLDRIVWGPGWTETPREVVRERMADLTRRPRWVIDGVSRMAEAAADLVVFLDVSPAVCTWRCAKRNWRYLLRSRPDLPEDCPEWAVIPRLLKIIWVHFPAARPRMIEQVASPETRARWRHVRTRRDRAEVVGLLELSRPNDSLRARP